MIPSLVRRILSWLPGAKEATAVEKPEAPQSKQFVYVKIPEPLMPLDRGSKYEDPIDAALAELNLGGVTGGGSQVGDDRPDGTPSIAFCGIDIDVTDLEEARNRLRTILVELGALPGTEIHFTIRDEKLQDELRTDGWLLRQPRTFLHPGFGV
jgi:hypothetical protein